MMQKMVPAKWRIWSETAAVLLLGLGLRLWFFRHANPVSGDTQIYGNIARNLLSHHVYSFVAEPGPFPPTLIRLPGYPLFLAACFSLFGLGNFAPVLYIQIAVDLLACMLLAQLAHQLFGDRAGRLALLLGCVCPFTANYTAAPLTETLTLATITVAFFCLDRWRRAARSPNGWLLGLGLALAASLLLRPEQALLGLAILPAVALMGLRKEKERAGKSLAGARPALSVALATTCMLLPLLPWTARNWYTFHRFQPIAPRYATDPGEPVPLGFQRWYRSWAIDFASTEEVYWNYDGTPILLSDLPSRAFDSPRQRLETAELLTDYNRTTNPTSALDVRFEALAQQRIAASPLRYYVLLPVARLANMLLRPRTELTGLPLAWWEWKGSRLQATTATCMALLNLLYFAAGLLGWLRWRRRAGGSELVLLWSMAAFVLLRCLLLLTLDNSEPRYTLEFFPLAILCASALLAPPIASSSRRS